jgi:hypothetical protein
MAGRLSNIAQIGKYLGCPLFHQFLHGSGTQTDFSGDLPDRPALLSQATHCLYDLQIVFRLRSAANTSLCFGTLQTCDGPFAQPDALLFRDGSENADHSLFEDSRAVGLEV